MAAMVVEQRYSLNELSSPQHLGVNRNFLAWLVDGYQIPHIRGPRGSVALNDAGVERLRWAIEDHERKRRNPVYG